MKKIFMFLWLFWILWVLFYSYIQYLQQEQDKKESIKVAIDNFQKVSEYLKENYNWNYPVPEGDLILLDNTNTLIHLEDRSKNLKDIENLAVIQWTTCDILQDDDEFSKINYDKRFSIKDEDGKILYKRCFSYAVTKDRKNFQVWTIINKTWKYETLLLWDAKDSITKSYNSSVLAKNGSEDFLPYPDSKLSPIVVLENKKDSNVKVNITPFDEKKYSIILKEWNNIILSWNSSSYDIEITWELNSNSNLKFIDTNGSIIYINPQEDSRHISFKIKEYSINDKKLDYFVETWRFLADIVRLWKEKEMNVIKDGVVLVIRWTKFTINVWKDSFDTFLNLWHIIQNIGNKVINLTLENAFSIIKNNEIVQDTEKVKKLAGFTVLKDLKTNPNYNFTINNIWNNITSAITWAYDFKKYKLSYENWQDIVFIVFNNSSKFLEYIKSNKKLLWIKENIKKDALYYENIVNQICASNNLWHWLDITKLYYILENKTDKLNWFSLKDAIKNKLWLSKNNYVVFTSRKYNDQYSNRLSYNSQTKSIDSYNFAKLSTTDSIEKAIFACDVK